VNYTKLEIYVSINNIHIVIKSINNCHDHVTKYTNLKVETDTRLV